MANANTTQTQASPGLFVNAPGVPIANIPGAQPLQVGMFPPNSNSQGATTTLAVTSNGALPINAIVNNEGSGQASQTISAVLSGSAGPPGDGGNISAPTLGIPFGSAANGGGGGAPGGAGGANFNNSGQGVLGDVQLGAAAPPQNLTFAGGTTATQYGG